MAGPTHEIYSLLRPRLKGDLLRRSYVEYD
jgi:hypothetical protein